MASSAIAATVSASSLSSASSSSISSASSSAISSAASVPLPATFEFEFSSTSPAIYSLLASSSRGAAPPPGSAAADDGIHVTAIPTSGPDAGNDNDVNGGAAEGDDDEGD